MLKILVEDVPGIDNAAGVPFLDAASLDEKTFVNEYVNKNKPCYIKGAIKHWRASKRWSDKNYLKELCGEVETSLYPHMNLMNAEKMQEGVVNTTFGNALEVMQNNDDDVLSMPQIDISKNAPFHRMADDIEGFLFYENPPKPLVYPDMRLFVYKGATTVWHIHHTDETLMCQIVGNKKVALLPPDEKTFEAVNEMFKNDKYLESEESIREYQNTIKDLDLSIVEVKQGDSLYIPPFWWHVVIPSSNDFGVTLAKCWRTPLHVMGDISFPAVREMWQMALTKLNSLTFMVLYYGTLSVCAKYARRVFSRA